MPVEATFFFKETEVPPSILRWVREGFVFAIARHATGLYQQRCEDRVLSTVVVGIDTWKIPSLSGQERQQGPDSGSVEGL